MINSGVVGFGFIGKVHVRAIRASGGVVAAIAAKTMEEAQSATAKMGIPKAVTIDEMVSDSELGGPSRAFGDIGVLSCQSPSKAGLANYLWSRDLARTSNCGNYQCQAACII